MFVFVHVLVVGLEEEYYNKSEIIGFDDVFSGMLI